MIYLLSIYSKLLTERSNIISLYKSLFFHGKAFPLFFCCSFISSRAISGTISYPLFAVLQVGLFFLPQVLLLAHRSYYYSLIQSFLFWIFLSVICSLANAVISHLVVYDMKISRAKITKTFLTMVKRCFYAFRFT